MGAPINGYISDKIIESRKKERGGGWFPEDRLRGVHLSSMVLMPASVLVAGFTTTYVDGPLGLAINLICLFVNGFGVSNPHSSGGFFGIV